MGDRLYLRDRVVAALACLQPGIDPVFLVLLSGNAAIPAEDHGLIVGASQLGMMLGALLYWRLPGRIGGAVSTVAAVVALAAALATTAADAVVPVVALRGLHGLSMGMLFTRAMSRAAARSAAHAFGTMFLYQLLLSSLVAALLPYIAELAGAAAALTALALVPTAILLLTLGEARGEPSALAPAEATQVGRGLPAASFAAAGALFLFICANMMLWSYVGASATAAGLSDADIGWGIAIGSLSGALPALAVSYLRQRLPLLAGGVASAVGTLAPLAVGPGTSAVGFVVLMILFNLGTTYAVIRASALAIDLDPTAATRRAVAAMNPVGMMAGPLMGYASMKLHGPPGLAGVAIFAVLAALLALAASGIAQGRGVGRARTV